MSENKLRVIQGTNVLTDANAQKLATYDNTCIITDTSGGIYLGNKSANPNIIATNNFNHLINKPTTLAGYGITDALSLSGGILNGNLQVNGYISSDNSNSNASHSRIRIIQIPIYSAFGYEPYSEYETVLAHDNEAYIKEVLKYICKTYTDYSGCIFMGKATPGTQGILKVYIYGNLNDEGYPQHCVGYMKTLYGTYDFISNGNYCADLRNYIANNIHPYGSGKFDLGSSALKWNNVFANNFIGNLTGTADKATTSYRVLSNSTNSAYEQDNAYDANPGLHFWKVGADSSNNSNDGFIFQWSWDNGASGGQLFVDDNPTNTMMIRGRNNSSNGGGFTDWKKFIHSGNYTEYTVPKTGGTFTGILSTSTIYPSTTNTNYCGVDAHRWKSVYTNDLSAAGTTYTRNLTVYNGINRADIFKNYQKGQYRNTSLMGYSEHQNVKGVRNLFNFGQITRDNLIIERSQDGSTWLDVTSTEFNNVRLLMTGDKQGSVKISYNGTSQNVGDRLRITFKPHFTDGCIYSEADNLDVLFTTQGGGFSTTIEYNTYSDQNTWNILELDNSILTGWPGHNCYGINQRIGGGSTQPYAYRFTFEQTALADTTLGSGYTGLGIIKKLWLFSSSTPYAAPSYVLYDPIYLDANSGLKAQYDLLPDTYANPKLGNWDNRWNGVYTNDLFIGPSDENFGGRICFGDYDDTDRNTYVYIGEEADDELILYASGGIKLSSGGDIVCDTNINAPAFYESSDETLKDFVEDIDVDLDQISNIPKKYFTWKADEDKQLNIGTSAQEIQKIYPEIVAEGKDGKLSVDYAKLSIIALAAIDKLNERIKVLEEKIK